MKVFTFDSALDHTFQDYLIASGMYFIMTHDGASPVPLDKDPRLVKNQDLDLESVEGEELQRRANFRTTIFHFVDYGYNVALIDGLEWMDTKVSHLLTDIIRTS